jgi:putative sugar O-methyltransferase
MNDTKSHKRTKTADEIVFKRVDEMFRNMKKGRAEVQPSKMWEALNKEGMGWLKKHKYKNFKRTMVRMYFAATPWYLMNRQTKFLILNNNPFTTLAALIKSILLPTHKLFTRIDSISFNFITYLLWAYTKKVDKEKLLERFEEPTIGNPPPIYNDGKLISQDVTNSILEFKSICDVIDRDKIETICELGGGSGRDAYIFITMLPHLKKYIFIDIPPALAIAEQYMEDVFPKKKIFKYREFKSFSEIKKEYEKADLLFFLPSQIEFIPKESIDLFLNISSLHEMRMDQIRYYFKEIERVTKKGKYFYLKAWKNSYIPFEEIYITLNDYPVNPHWKTLFKREAKVQIKFFEQLLQLKKR